MPDSMFRYGRNESHKSALENVSFTFSWALVISFFIFVRSQCCLMCMENIVYSRGFYSSFDPKATKRNDDLDVCIFVCVYFSFKIEALHTSPVISF